MADDTRLADGETVTATPGYRLSDAVALFMQQTAIMTTLWTVYVAATFAGAGFGISSPALDWRVAAAVTIGFWLFTLGHLALLRQTLRVLQVVRGEIAEAVARADDRLQFRGTLVKISRTSNPVRVAVAVHCGIDLCVTIAIWSRVSTPFP